MTLTTNTDYFYQTMAFSGFYTLQWKVYLFRRQDTNVVHPPEPSGAGARSSIHINYVKQRSAKSPTTNFVPKRQISVCPQGRASMLSTLLTPRILRWILGYGKSAYICCKIKICHYVTYMQTSWTPVVKPWALRNNVTVPAAFVATSRTGPH